MKRLLVAIGMLIAAFGASVFLFGGVSCACDELGGNRFVVLNPIRDRSPEVSAQRFFLDLAGGRCAPPDSDLCRRAREYSIVEWKLVTGENEKDGKTFYYRIKDRLPPQDIAGYAYVRVRRTSSGWQVVDFSGVR